jgi:hypothetical protein
MATMKWQPAWWNENHASAWDRVKEAMRRDWEQTKHDLHIKGGHELNQDVGDTVKQATGKEPIPTDDRLNPAKVVGDWNDVEVPLGYGFAARDKYGKEHAAWTSELETTLKTEWDSAKSSTGRGWEDVKEHVRRGYEYKR